MIEYSIFFCGGAGWVVACNEYALCCCTAKYSRTAVINNAIQNTMVLFFVVKWPPKNAAKFSVLGGLHRGPAQQCCGFGRRHELDQLASHRGILRHIADGDAEVPVFDKVRG